MFLITDNVLPTTVLINVNPAYENLHKMVHIKNHLPSLLEYNICQIGLSSMPNQVCHDKQICQICQN